MKRLRICAAALMCLLLALCPASNGLGSSVRGINNNGAFMDTNGANGYSGDYVIIYNPSASAQSRLSTGSIGSLIETAAAPENAIGEYEVDVDSALLADYLSKHGEDTVLFDERAAAMDYNVGDTRVFTLNNYSPLGSQVEFKLLAAGQYCYVWTPTSQASNVYPLDSIDDSYAAIACQKFDESYPLLMQYLDSVQAASTGNRISLLYYNIDDGWTSGNPYLGGFFSSADCSSNGIPVISLDTYPGVYHPTEDGGWDSRFERSFGIAVHEYQHMVNFLRASGKMEFWLNECMSAAAEEFCYPGSCLVQRIPGWVNNNIVGQGLQLDPPDEYAYTPEFAVHNGASLYEWQDGQADVGALYGRGTLFSQYLYTHFGNEVFHSILMNYKTAGSAAAVLQQATGLSMSELVKRFYIALTANDAEGDYSFAMQQGYDPAEYYGAESLYDWLSPVVYTGSGLEIAGGGAVTIKPVGGTYYPPEDAADGLVYIGVTLDLGLKGDVDGDGDVDGNDALLLMRFSMDLVGLTDPQLARADVDENGSVNANDSLRIMRYKLGLIPEL